MQPVISADIVKIILEGTNLNGGQRIAAELITTTANRVIGVQAFASTGKSHMLDTAKQMIEAQGYEDAHWRPMAARLPQRELIQMGLDKCANQKSSLSII